MKPFSLGSHRESLLLLHVGRDPALYDFTELGWELIMNDKGPYHSY